MGRAVLLPNLSLDDESRSRRHRGDARSKDGALEPGSAMPPDRVRGCGRVSGQEPQDYDLYSAEGRMAGHVRWPPGRTPIVSVARTSNPDF